MGTIAEVGNACKVNLILQTIIGVSLVGLAEALALGNIYNINFENIIEMVVLIILYNMIFYLADRFSISLKDIIDIFELTSMKSQFLLTKGKGMHLIEIISFI